MRGDAGEQSFPFVRRRGPLALIGLSSATIRPPFWATGFLGTAQLQRLGETLQQLGRERLFRVVLVHHPIRSRPSRYFKRLLDGPAFREVLAKHGAELVIHGHDHVHSLDWVDGPGLRIPAVGVPSASHTPTAGGDAPAGYNLYRIDATEHGWGCEVVSRSLADDGTNMVEVGRAVLSGTAIVRARV
jgi:3',5'-cyclic AMP phosphodiesterase CpdA